MYGSLNESGKTIEGTIAQGFGIPLFLICWKTSRRARPSYNSEKTKKFSPRVTPPKASISFKRGR